LDINKDFLIPISKNQLIFQDSVSLVEWPIFPFPIDIFVRLEFLLGRNSNGYLDRLKSKNWPYRPIRPIISPFRTFHGCHFVATALCKHIAIMVPIKGSRLLFFGLIIIGFANTLSVLFASREGFGGAQRVDIGELDTIANPTGVHLIKDRHKEQKKRKRKQREKKKRSNKIRDESKALVATTVPKFAPQHKPSKRPSLDSLISDRVDGVKGDVRWLLDFAILGHAKCATSYLMRWLNAHPEVQIWDREVCDLYDLKPAELTRKLYEELPEGNFQRGFKCPGHFSRRSMQYFRRYFGKTNLIVGLRHPIRWFERYVNKFLFA